MDRDTRPPQTQTNRHSVFLFLTGVRKTPWEEDFESLERVKELYFGARENYDIQESDDSPFE